MDYDLTGKIMAFTPSRGEGDLPTLIVGTGTVQLVPHLGGSQYVITVKQWDFVKEVTLESGQEALVTMMTSTP